MVEGIYKIPIAVSEQHFGAFTKTMVSTSKILNSPSGICGHKTFRTPDLFACVISPLGVYGHLRQFGDTPHIS